MTSRRILRIFYVGIGVLVASCNGQSVAASAGRPPEQDTLSLQQQVAELQAAVAELQAQVKALQKGATPVSPQITSADRAAATTSANSSVSANSPTLASSQTSSGTAPNQPLPSALLSLLPGNTTINLFLDGYYSYNFNDPIGRVNLLRAYDVSSNAFSINQAGLVIESAPDPDHGKPFGARLDFQYGQATQATQGNPLNEPRPEIYRNIFQAYGTYVAPIGKGLTLDFGKFASSLGYEGNYTKDQINYSRSFWFDFLPFYHLGVRANYKFNDKLALNYWVVNGTNQSEPFNGFKDQFVGLAITPTKNITWNIQYYFGQEHPDVIYFPNGGAPANAPTLQGVPFEPIANSAHGKLHIIDSWASWQLTPKWLIAGEADDLVQRLNENSQPVHTDGGAGYLKYQATSHLYFGGRAEYLSDRGGSFTGVTQAVKDLTFTTAYRFDEGFEVVSEWRRDFSNQPYFYTDTLNILKRQQNTATVGLLWWFGQKQGSW